MTKLFNTEKKISKLHLTSLELEWRHSLERRQFEVPVYVSAINGPYRIKGFIGSNVKYDIDSSSWDKSWLTEEKKRTVLSLHKLFII